MRSILPVAKWMLSELKLVLNWFKKDERGATLMEYTVLLGLLVVVVLAILAFVGAKLSGQWSALRVSP